MLARFTVVFDYPHQQLIVAPNSHFPSDDQEDKSGISVVANGNMLRTFEVVEVTPGTPAAKAGIQKGDIIAGIDEDPAADLTLAEIRELFRQIGHKYTLVIERNGQSKRITVEMRRQI
jgi:C-terminal processing protease CtpA/Prc